MLKKSAQIGTTAVICWTILCFFQLNIVQACPDIDGLMDVNCNRKLEIIAFGDSTTYGRSDEADMGGYPGRLQQTFPNAIIYNLGKPGEKTSYGRIRASLTFRQIASADYVIILEGVNDYWEPNHTSQGTASNLFAIVNHAKNIGALTLLATLTPVKREDQKPWVRSVNSRIYAWTAIDFYSLGESIISWDKVHPDAYGYTLMRDLAAQALRVSSITYRPIDSDGDGLYDWKELDIGSNIYVQDTDGDGLKDGEDFGSGGSPLLTDSDGDGLSDYQEVKQIGSDPADPKFGAPTIKAVKILS